MNNKDKNNPSIIGDEQNRECPYCGCKNTSIENCRGPSICREIYFCLDCKEQFEALRT